MRSIGFPKMLGGNSAVIVSGHEATARNLRSLLLSEKGEFKADPGFGVALKRRTFDQNDAVLKDVILDEIYTQIALFMPQMKVSRNDISITQSRARLSATVKALNLLDYKTDTYSLALLSEAEQ